MSFETASDHWTPRARPQPLLPSRGTGPAAALRAEAVEASEIGSHQSHATARQDFSFADLLDVINPLQHLPVVGPLYRKLTGDQLAGPSRIMGGFLYNGLLLGGPLGFVSTLAGAVAAEAAGGDPGEKLLDQVASLFEGRPEPAPAAATSFAALPQAGQASIPMGERHAQAKAPQPAEERLEGAAALRAFLADSASGPGPAAAGPAASAQASRQAAPPASTAPGTGIPLTPRDWSGQVSARAPLPGATTFAARRIQGSGQNLRSEAAHEAALLAKAMPDQVAPAGGSRKPAAPAGADFSQQLLGTLDRHLAGPGRGAYGAAPAGPRPGRVTDRSL